MVTVAEGSRAGAHAQIKARTPRHPISANSENDCLDPRQTGARCFAQRSAHIPLGNYGQVIS